MALCVQLDVEQKLQWDITAEPDTTVTALIADAQAQIEIYVGRSLESANRTELFDGGTMALWPRWWPVTTVNSLTEDGTALVEGTDFMLYERTGKLIRISGGYQIPWKTLKAQSISVDYEGGFLAAAEPDHDLALEHLGSICSEIVARAFHKGAEIAELPAGTSGIKSVTLQGSDSVSYATEAGSLHSIDGGLAQFVFLTDDEKHQLDRYRRTWLGFA